MASRLILSLDVGTSAAKAALFDLRGRRVFVDRRRLPLVEVGEDGFEQPPERYVTAVRSLLASVAADLPRAATVLAGGVACQRASAVIWNRATGRPRGPAVLWMDRRAAGLVDRLRGRAGLVASRTGLRLSPHYGAAHLARRFAAEPSLLRDAREGLLAAGPVGAFVLSRLARHPERGSEPSCDPTLAQRTLLYDLKKGRWDDALCRLFRVPPACLPDLHPSLSHRGTLAIGRRSVPVLAMAGDQQAATAAFDLDPPGRSALVHYGTGAFALWTARRNGRRPRDLLHSARADRPDGAYVEGTVNSAGSALDRIRRWTGGRPLEPGMGARDLPGAEGAFLVPAFAGLASPYWDPEARSVLWGLDRADGPSDLFVAALRGIAHRIADVFEAAGESLAPRAPVIASGPLATIPALVRLQADLSGRRVGVSKEPEATLRGMARLAAREAGERGFPAATSGRAVAPRLKDSERRRVRRTWERVVEGIAR